MVTVRYANTGDAAAIAALWNPQILETPFTFDLNAYSAVGSIS